MFELLWALLFLGIAATCNWCLGIYEKIGVEQITWNWKEFARGIIKIIIICGVTIGLGFAWYYSNIDLSGAGLEPLTLTTTATAYYFYKAIKHLAAILTANKTETVSDEEFDINPLDVGLEGGESEVADDIEQ